MLNRTPRRRSSDYLPPPLISVLRVQCFLILAGKANDALARVLVSVWCGWKFLKENKNKIFISIFSFSKT